MELVLIVMIVVFGAASCDQGSLELKQEQDRKAMEMGYCQVPVLAEKLPNGAESFSLAWQKCPETKKP